MLPDARVPAHTIARRYVESVRQINETENAPAPGAYETAGSAFRRDGGVKWNDPAIFSSKRMSSIGSVT